MAADVESTNLCCAKLKKQYSKLELKRNALRQTVELLELQVNKLMGENSNLRKAYEEEHMLHELEKEAKAKESIIREDPKKEIHDLKPETPSCQESGCSRSLLEDRIKLLEASITTGDSEIRRLKGLLEKEKIRGESEIGRLKGLLEKEKIRGDSETKKAEEEKKKAAEAHKLLVMEKSTVDKERRLTEAERKHAKEYRLSLEKLKSEVNEYREKLIMEKSKANDAVKKVEAEKQKACKEKKRADLERTKSEEQRRLMEIERKKAMEERGHVVQLSQQLEEEKLRREELQTRLEETVSVEKESQCSCVASNTETTYVKLLKEKLNLEKKRVKCAKRSAQIEKAEKNVLCQQINVLKQHFIQVSRHLSMLDGCFNIEGKEDWTKIKESPEIQGSKLQKFLSTKPCDFNSQSDIGLVNSFYNGSSNYSDSTKEPTGVHLSEGGRKRPMSGISSELESQINHSVRNKSQSSAVCSTTTNFSDRTFMGSQERGDLFVNTSDKLRESSLNRKSSVTKLVKKAGSFAKTGDVTKITEGNVEGVHFDSSVNDENEYAEGVSGRCTKKRRILETMESISWLYTEDSQLRLKMGEKLSALKGYLSIKDGLPAIIHSHNSDSVHLYHGRDLVTERHDDVNRLNYHCGMDEGPPKQQIIDFEPSIRNDNHQQIDPSETGMICSDGADMVNTVFQDFLKLLELDNDDDERRYREAIGMPLSPTLPEINSPRSRLYIEDKSHYLVEESTIRSQFERDNSVSCPTINVIDLEIKSNMLNLKASNSCELVSDSTFIQSSIDSEQLEKYGHTPFCNIEISNLSRDTLTVENGPEQASRSDQVLSLSLHKNHMEGEDKELDNTVNADCVEEKRIDSCKHAGDFLVDGQDAQTSMHLVSEYGSVESTKKTHLSTIRKLEDPSGGNCSLDGMCKFCVLFSNNREQDSITRIIHATNTIIHKLMVQIDSDIAEILRALTERTDLLLEERVSVFFSLLLFICGTSLANSKGILNDDIHLFSESFTLKIDRVISDRETNWLFNDMCQLEILLNLIEDFLINRRIVMYDVMIQSKQFSPGISFGTAKVDQLVSASIIFTCICVSVNHIGFILKASYKILRSCREDTYWTLSVLHVFASLAGKNFFISDDHNFLKATISSVVSLIERGPESHTSITPRHSACDAVPVFPPCDECPFYSKTVSLDKVTHSLLDALHNYMLKECIERPEGCNDGLDLDCDASCMLNYRKNDTGHERSFCHYTDIISLVELVGCYKCWDWTSNNIIPRLLEILESCVSEEFAAALFVLIGQIAMFGVNAGGYQQTEVVNLRCNLAMIVDAFIARKRSFPTELAAVGTLLDLLPFDFREIVDGCLVHTVDASELGHAQLIKKWFSQLSMELQSLSLSLFRRTAAIQKT